MEQALARIMWGLGVPYRRQCGSARLEITLRRVPLPEPEVALSWAIEAHVGRVGSLYRDQGYD